MKLEKNIKSDIQCFVYFLFKGTLVQADKQNNINYLDVLLCKPELLYNCFEIFVYNQQTLKTSDKQSVEDYIRQTINNTEFPIKDIIESNLRNNNYWNNLLGLAYKFCHNQFQDEGIYIDLELLYGNGTDAVPMFSIWSNIIEIDTNQKVTNSNHVSNRLIQRFSNSSQGEFIPKFEEWEIEQEIY